MSPRLAALMLGASALIAGACSGEAVIGNGGGAGGQAGTGGQSNPSGGTDANPGSAGDSAGGEQFGGAPGFPGTPLTRASKLDLLLVVDNSIMMASKQALFAQALPRFLERLVNPECIGANGRVLADGPDVDCPAGTAREFTPLTDIHVGVISTSLGAHGGQQICVQGGAEDDKARLIPLLRAGATTTGGNGFTRWAAAPDGISDVSVFVTEVIDTVRRVGDTGCGYENQLEAWYRFLVDPEPPLEVIAMEGVRGIDEAILAQRAEFLRPDSAVAVLLVTDENDCSIRDDESAFLHGLQELAGTRFLMPPATSACDADPNHPCCRSCADGDITPSGCPTSSSDPACQRDELPIEEDNANLRCWEQKRRFGFDLLHPTSRYVEGLRSPTVLGRDGRRHSNPLFSEHEGRSRRPSLVTFGAILGVPWPDVADAASLEGDGLELLDAQALASEGRWALMTRASATDQPDDPFMIESIAARTGTHPLTNDELLPPGAPVHNALNGHEARYADGSHLQAACTFPLAMPVECRVDAVWCKCDPQASLYEASECEPPGGGPSGNTQYSDVALPGLRQLEVLSRIGESAVVGSACPKVLDEGDPDYGYAPALRAVGDRLRDTLQ